MTDFAAAETPTQTAPSSSDAHPPSQEGASAPPEERQSLTHSERRAKLMARLREGAAERQPDTSPSSATPPVRDGEGFSADAKSPDATKPSEDKPQKFADADREYELRLSRLSRELRDAKADAIEARQKVSAHDALSTKLERAKGDPHHAVQLLPELFGMDFGQLADWIVMNESKYRERSRYAELPPEVREELELAKKERAERQQRENDEREQAGHRAQFESYRDSAAKYIEANKADYPLSSAIGWAAGQIARNALQQGTRDARPLLDELEKNLRSELTEALGKPDVVRALIKGDASLADKVREALSNQPNKSSAAASLRSGPTANADGPRSLNNGVTASDVAGSYNARQARRSRITEALKAQMYGR